MSKKPIAMTTSPVYVKFTNNRDRVLECILHWHLCAIDQLVGKLKDKILVLCADRRYAHAAATHSAGPIRHEFELVSAQMSTIFTRMRAETYYFAHISECEAIGRTLEKKQRHNVHTKIHAKKPLHDGVHVADRVQIACDRLRRKVEDAISLSLILGDDRADMQARVLRAFPLSRKRPQHTRVLKKAIRESSTWEGAKSGEQKGSMTFGFADDDLWNDVLKDYNATTLPSDIFARGPTDKTLFYDATTDKEEERYAWEVEQEVREDFVRSVRSGTQEAAVENGIDDFQWIAILDEHTDECCEIRDGQSSADIEAAIDSGKLDDTDSDAIVPPAHFRCRCNSAPLTDDMPDAPTVDYGSFDDWLSNGVSNQ